MALNYTAVLVFTAALFAVYIIMWVFVKPIKFLLKSAVGGIAGSAALYLCNVIAAPLGFSVGINLYTSSICAFLGIPGFLLIIAGKIVFG